MTTDLWMLVGAAALHFAIIMIATTPTLMGSGGIEWGLGNREEPAQVPAWAGRAKRASANLLENLPYFIILVLVAHVTGKANDSTALGAMIFMGARVAHALVYIGGVPGLRTACWLGSLGGLGLIAAQLAG